jgi:hypothetical protein
VSLRSKLSFFNIDLIQLNKSEPTGNFEYYIFHSFFCKISFSNYWGAYFTLKLLKPNIIFLIDYDYFLTKAANKIGISVCYIQHGVINENHHIWEKANNDNLEFSIFLWDDESGQVFNSRINKYVFGNLWFNYLLDDSLDDLKIQIFNEYKFFLKWPHLPVILVSLTHSNPDVKYFTNELVNTLKKKFKSYNWLIRLHPCMLSKDDLLEFEFYLKSNFSQAVLEYVEWEKSSFFPLPLILQIVNFHITIESSTIIDADLFNIPSFLLNDKCLQLAPDGNSYPPFGGPNYFKSQILKGSLKVFNRDFTSIESWLNQSNPIARPFSFKIDDQKFKKCLFNLNLYDSYN